ncbi:hypothetical protein BDZ94DRAFT_1261334 [Collybia nuda]|uniref:Uncharacterized protein n=1 Tax=Collybia nuda TaxID=64659 RepID=A0A9P5Y775_9AGAR|nr:hypothetical protein BDZ94DRAFT_1261334 [Collybia nuda]
MSKLCITSLALGCLSTAPPINIHNELLNAHLRRKMPGKTSWRAELGKIKKLNCT